MYFDDCERRDVDDVWSMDGSNNKATSPWIMSRSEEKRLAMEQFLGYTPESTAKLSDEQVEDEILQWAVDTHVVGGGDDDKTACKYNVISDLIVASSCVTAEESLALLWEQLAGLLELQEQDSVYMIAFPKATDLWDYDTMVLVLQAIQVSKSLLPPEFDVKIDLFHPDYKHSPKMWSPETHAPFPTVGIQVVRPPTQRDDEIEDLGAAHTKLDALFNSIDAVHGTQVKNDSTTDQVLEISKNWVSELSHELFSDTAKASMTWTVQPHKQPYQLYATLWDAIIKLKESESSRMIVAPNLDAHTTHRIAVTINAALRRLDVPVRISHVFHPGNGDKRAPYAMIHLVYNR